MRSFRSLALPAAAVALYAPLAAHALGTAAGTNIQNTAQVDYTVAGAPQNTTSNAASVTVVEMLDVVVTIASPALAVSAGATQQELVFTVTNTGNGTETFSLAGLSAIPGDDFDPAPSATFIYFDTDDSGDLSATDVAYVAGTNDPSLAADASVRVILVNDIPAGVASADRGRSQLAATALTGAGAPGTVYANQGTGGVDAVVGATGADGDASGEYVVQGLQLTAVKSQTILDQFGGARALPGARINYQILVSLTGSGTATAAAFSDLIPANTTYVAGTLELNNAVLTDTADADAGEYALSPAPQVRINLGDLTQAAGPQTIEFAVTIN